MYSYRVLKTIIIVLAFIDGICSKELQIKQDLELKDKYIKDIINILNSDDTYIKNERFARHLEAVTESVLEHFISGLKRQYSNPTATRRAPMMNLLRRIKQQLIRNNSKKVIRNKKKIKRKHKGNTHGRLTTKKMEIAKQNKSYI